MDLRVLTSALYARAVLGATALSAAHAACADAPGRTGAAVASIRFGEAVSTSGATVALVGGPALCSGVLVSERLVVTAAHCLGPATPDTVVVGIDVTAPVDTIGVAHREAHPGYDPETGADDAAVVVLDAPVDGPLAPLAKSEAALEVGARVRLVGFGTDETGATGVAQEGWARVSQVDPRRFSVVGDPAEPCHGDSGGPAFADSGVLVGLVSRGDPDCEVEAQLTRVDTLLQELIVPWIEATADGAAAAGERCFSDDNCAEGSCVAPADAPSHRYCAPPCSSVHDCPVEMAVCADGRCAHPKPSPGAGGSQCAADADCDSRRCGRSTSGSVCTVACDPEGLPCAQGFRCAADDSRPGQHACFELPGPAPHTGCAVSRDARARLGGVASLLSALVAWATRRRARLASTTASRRNS